MEKAKILIVEDEMISAAALRNDLRNMGYEVCPMAATGKKAIGIAETDHPDVVLMDIKLRGEMNGVEAAEEIRSRTGAPSILMSGYSDEVIERMLKDGESFRVLSKPIEKEAVKEAIGDLLGD